MSVSQNLKYFVGGVPSDVRHKDLYDFFRKYGVVKRVTVFNSENCKRLFGFCFVKFKKVYGGELDLRNTEFIFQGRKLEVDYIVRRSNLKNSVNEKHSRRVFLQNVPSYFEKPDLLKLFSPFGSITNCFTVNRAPRAEDQMKREHQQAASKYGYVIFDHKEDAEEVLRRRFVEVNSKTKIHIKRYCSTINRLTSEDGTAHQQPARSVLSEEKRKQSGATLSFEDRSRRILEELMIHQLKPTSKGYHQGQTCPWKEEQGVNFRFNISLL